MDDRAARLLDKAEKAVDDGDTDQAYAYLSCIAATVDVRRREAKDLARMVEHGTRDA